MSKTSSKKTAARSSKKSAKTTARKATTAKATASARTVVGGEAKITAVSKENPRRAGSVQFDRFAVVQKFSGKTVAQFMAGGGDRDALRYAVHTGDAKLGK